MLMTAYIIMGLAMLGFLGFVIMAVVYAFKCDGYK